MKKILLIVLAVVVAATLVSVFIYRQRAGFTKVLIAKTVRQNLSTVVSGTGQIKPKTYVNVGATSFGRITHLYVKEGDQVKKGQTIATVENVQPQANVEAQKAQINSAKTDVNAYVAAENTAKANVERAKADLVQKKLDWERAQELFKAGVVSKQDFDAKQAAFNTDVAALNQAEAQQAQAKAQTESARSKINNANAMLRYNQDALSKTVSVAPFDGIVTNLPVREGETVVVGIQNAQGSTLMTLADMSVITAEVKVDETDIVNVQIGQIADVTVDALPGKIFKGTVTLVGDQAILRSTGISTSQSTTGTEEAKDFKVVVTLSDPSGDLRPGLSCTAKITTAHKTNILTLPIQALTLRPAESADGKKSDATSPATPTGSAAKSPAPQGVFVVTKDARGRLRATFTTVTTGITGATEIEVLSGLSEGQEIVIGPYKTLRNLKDKALVKRDTDKPAASTDTKS